MSTLTPVEKKWLKKLQKVLDAQPTKRIQFYTTGDHDLTAYDAEIMEPLKDIYRNDDVEYFIEIQEADALLGAEIIFKNQVDSLAG